MASYGLYDGSGTFFSKIGIPAKSGAGGGTPTAVPGKLGLAAFCSAVDGRRIIEEISRAEQLSVLGIDQ